MASYVTIKLHFLYFNLIWYTTGYLGDKIGYNTVLVVNLIGCALAQTAFDWTPRFYEHHRTPTLSILQNETFSSDEILQFVWPLHCNLTNITIEDCETNIEELYDTEFWQNINQYLCENVNGSSINADPVFKCKFPFTHMLGRLLLCHW